MNNHGFSGEELLSITTRCGRYILSHLDTILPSATLAQEAEEACRGAENPADAIASLCKGMGLCVCERRGATPDDMSVALSKGHQVMLFVGPQVLSGDASQDGAKDKSDGQRTSRVLFPLAVDDRILVAEPASSSNEPLSIPRERLMEAWKDSGGHFIYVDTFKKIAEGYSPSPLDLSGVSLPEGLNELTEAIAENTHEVWAKGRKDGGWTFGAVRDDEKKHHPDMLPYGALTEDEKEFDRTTALSAIRLILKLGYTIKKD